MKDYLRTIALKSVSNIYNTQKFPHNQMNYTGVFFMRRKVQQAPSIFYYVDLWDFIVSTDPELHTAEPHRAHSDAVWT